MNKNIIIIFSFIVFISTGCSKLEDIKLEDKKLKNTPCIISIINWVDFIMYNDIHYDSNTHMTEVELRNIQLGDEYFRVNFNVSENVDETDYIIKNGDAGYCDKGTIVYTVVGYNTDFRLAIETENGIKVYEAYYNPEALTGSDYFDIKDKVEYITINSEEDAQSIIVTIDKKEDINNIVLSLLSSTILKEEEIDYSRKRYFLELHLLDGTSVTRSYWIDEGVIAPYLLLPNEVKQIVLSYMAE